MCSMGSMMPFAAYFPVYLGSLFGSMLVSVLFFSKQKGLDHRSHKNNLLK